MREVVQETDGRRCWKEVIRYRLEKLHPASPLLPFSIYSDTHLMNMGLNT